jgi:polyhydroxyalkanoate synthesis regulator phasin
MELAVIWFLSVVAMGEEVKKVDAKVEVLQEEVAQLQDNFITLAGKHSAHAARSNTIDQRHDGELELLIDEVNTNTQKTQYLDEKIQILHP